jgi:hypothetical protein
MRCFSLISGFDGAASASVQDYPLEALEIDGRGAAPAQLTAPLLCLIDAHCAVVPPDTVLPVFGGRRQRRQDPASLRARARRLQHVGPLAGPRAHASLWPRIARWMQAH